MSIVYIVSRVNGEDPIVCVDRKKADILASALTSGEGVQHKVVDAVLVGKIAEVKKPSLLARCPSRDRMDEHVMGM